MKPGFYIVTRAAVLSHPEESLKVRINSGTWIITDGFNVGWFEKEDQLDWLPLQWKKGKPILLEGGVEKQLSAIVNPMSIHKLKDEFYKLVFVEPGELLPDMPKPPLNRLDSYLKSRRNLTAFSYTYDRR